MGQLDSILTEQLSKTLDGTDLPTLGDKYEGKVRDNYVHWVNGEAQRVIVVTDRLSAFDVIITTIPFKGQVLNQLAEYWFRETSHLVGNHVIEVPDANTMVVKQCEPLKAEFVMRSYLTGNTSTSIWRAYERGERMFCGHSLPDGMRKNQPLPAAILTPSTKAEQGDHDVSVSREQLIESGCISAEHFDAAAEMAHKLFLFGQARARERGLILVDTKYEMGITPSGDIVLIDEIHTPDSSRYWFADDFDDRFARGEEPRSLDKDYVRRWLVKEHDYRGDGAPPPVPDEVRLEAARRYIANYELMTGKTFVPDIDPPAQRIAKNLGVSI